MYEQAKKYQKYYGNLEVPKKFRTDDIYTYDKNGKIKAVKKGKAKVTITSGKIKSVITVTVK